MKKPLKKTILNQIFYKFLVCLILISTSSCITKYIWGDKKYEEKISQFLVGEDGRYVVMIGQYHYVFIDEAKTFSRILKLKQTGLLTIDSKQSYLRLDGNNDIKGFITIRGPFSFLPIEDIGVLNSMGYYPDRNDNLTIKIAVNGRRYLSRYLGQATQVTTNPIKISINYNDSSLAQDVGKAAITPVAVGLDAVLLIGKIAIAPFRL